VVAACVARVPRAGRSTCLLDDVEAEHIPGLATWPFRREVLEEIGGFDPIYRSAGDERWTSAWRLQDPRVPHRLSARRPWFWHFRRNTMKAYIGQQKGYGQGGGPCSTSVIPSAFNALGYSRLAGGRYLRRHLRPLLAAPAR